MNESRMATDRTPPPPHRRRPIHPAWWVVIVLIAVIVGSIRFLPRRTERVVETIYRRVPVRVVPATASGIRDFLEMPGRVEAIYAATIAAERAGRIVEIAVDRGDRVQAGTTIARVASAAWEARREQAEIELREATRDLARREALARTGAIAPHELDAARARCDRAKAGLAEASEYLRQCTLVAPVAGEITDRFVELGEHVAEGQAIVRIVDVCSVRVIVDVPESRVNDIPVGTPARILVRETPEGLRTASVSFVSTEADARSRTFRAEIRLDNADRWLRAGQFVRVEVDRTMPAGWIAVPLSALIPRRGEYVLFVVTDGRAERRQVELERIAGDFALLSSGVAVGDLVVVEGQRDLADGMNVDVISTAEPVP